MLEMNFSNITFSGIAIWSHKTCCRRRRCDPRDQLATHPLLRSKLKHSVVVVRWLCVWSSFFLSLYSGCPSENADGNRCPNCGSPLQSRRGRRFSWYLAMVSRWREAQISELRQQEFHQIKCNPHTRDVFLALYYPRPNGISFHLSP